MLVAGLTLSILSNEVWGGQPVKLGEDWIFYGKNYQGKHYYDKNSIICPYNSKAIVRVWETTIYGEGGTNSYIQELVNKGITRDTISQMGIDKLATMETQLEIDCKEMRYGAVQVILYDKNGKTLDKYSYSPIQRNQSVEEGMVIERLFKKACNF
jgi:hypothetical protein